MKKLIGTLLSALIFMGLLLSLAVPALAVPAEAPEWEKGDSWAYGRESNVGTEFQQQLQNLSTALETITNSTVNELSIDGEVGMWLLFEVTKATADEYVMSTTMAGKMSMDAALSVTGMAEVEGTYSWSEEKNKEEKTMSIEVGAEIAILVKVDMTFERDSMAVKSIDFNVKVNAAMDFVAVNLPMNKDNWNNWTTSYWYEDYDISGEMDFNLELSLDFSPALNVWDFPLSKGDQWTVDSIATLSGSMSGMLDVRGLPEDTMNDIFTDKFADETGITGFPIVFEDIVADDSPFANGKINETSEEIEFDLKCTRMFTEFGTFWGDITVYEIKVQDTPVRFYYSPQVGFMSFMSVNMGDLADELELPISMGGETMRLDAVDPDVAKGKIDEISEFQGGIGNDEGGFMSFFTKAPYLGLILVGVIAIVVVAAVLLIRKK